MYEQRTNLEAGGVNIVEAAMAGMDEEAAMDLMYSMAGKKQNDMEEQMREDHKASMRMTTADGSYKRAQTLDELDM